jgi:hypothetical protein
MPSFASQASSVLASRMKRADAVRGRFAITVYCGRQRSPENNMESTLERMQAFAA